MRSWRRSLLCLTALTLLAGCAAGKPAPDRQVARYAIEDFLGVTNYRGASFSRDNSSVLVSSDASGVYNVYALPTGGGDPRPLTRSTTDSIFAESWFPGDDRFLYSSDRGGDELSHIFVMETDGKVTDLTPGEKVKAEFHGWARDDSSFFAGTNERDQRFFDIYQYAAGDYARKMIYQDDTGYDLAAISPDGRYLAFGKQRTTSDSDIYLHDRQTGVTQHITPHAGDVAHEAQDFSADGTGLYYTTDEGREFAALYRYDLATGDRREVVAPQWDVLFTSVSRNGKYLVVGINNDGRTEIRLYEAASMKPIGLPALPDAEIASIAIARDESTMAFYASASRIPRDLFVADLPGGEPRRLTRSLPAAIDPDHLVEARVVRFQSYDGVEIPGLLYKPHASGPDAKAPALVWVHGGPGGQSRVGYSGLIQYLANHGYAIYAINNRGSSGYGKTFYAMDDRRHGEADLGDCVASKQMLIDTGYVDPKRIGILGGSYGGYMVLAAMTLRPEEFAVGVDLFGISNWVRTLESIPPYWESFRLALYAEMGDPASDKERLTRVSPLFNADNIARPLMVLQGANDPRVLKVESDEIVEAARARGVAVEYIVFDDEGHGFVKKENQLRGYRAIREFLDKHL